MRPATIPAFLLAALLAACDTEPTRLTVPTRSADVERSEYRFFPSSEWTLVELPFMPTAINDAGVIVGNKNGEAVRWQNGVLTVLPHKPGVAGPYQAIDISGSGLILGEASGHGLMWLIPSLEPMDISPEPFKPILPRAINNRFAVVGAYLGAQLGHVFRYTPTTGVRDVTPQDAFGATMTDLNDAGYASGFMTATFSPNLVVAPVRWDSTGASQLLQTSATGGAAYTINNNNVVAGVSSLGVTLWGPNSLSSAVGDAGSLLGCIPTAISDAGRLVGYNCLSGVGRSWTYYQGTFKWIDHPVPASGLGLILVDVSTCGSFIGASLGGDMRDKGYLWIKSDGISPTCDAPPVKTVTATAAP